MTAALAAHLVALGIGKGDRVALAMRNLREWSVAFFAGVAIGAVVVPLNARWTGAELEYGLRDSGARVLIVDDQHARLESLYAALPDLGRVIVARATTPLAEGVQRLEEVIGTPHD